MPEPTWIFIGILGSGFFYLLNAVALSFSEKLPIWAALGRWPSRRGLLAALVGGAGACICLHLEQRLPAAATLFLFLALLMLVARVDIDTMEIPNEFVVAMLVLGAVSCLTMPRIGLASRGLGFFCVSVPLLLITLWIPDAFGGGDIKLMAAAGVFMGAKLVIIAFILGILTGSIYGAYLLLAGKKEGKAHFAFGPFLCVGMVGAWFFGDVLLHWYLGI